MTVEALFTKYGWIIIGLTFGLAAKYALLIKRGVRIRAHLILADMLLLPLVALLAYSIAAKLGAVGEAQALVTAFSAVGADRLIKMATDRFLARVEGALPPQPERKEL